MAKLEDGRPVLLQSSGVKQSLNLLLLKQVVLSVQSLTLQESNLFCLK